MTDSLAERIGSLALSTFNTLPSRCKPRTNPNGTREWTPMSAIILALQPNNTDEEELRCISLATGTKCLPSSAIKRCKGMVLHDSHAETLAFRGLNCFLLREVQNILEDEMEVKGYESFYLERRNDVEERSSEHDEGRPFQLRPSVSIYLFSTTAPCGDASMELLMRSKPSVEAVPWSTETLKSEIEAGGPLGRGHFSLLGQVRRKPARADAESTLSKSCTDKMALKQFTGSLGFPADLVIERTGEAYLKGVVVYEAEYDRRGYERAFGREGRLTRVDEAVEGHHFDVLVLLGGFERFKFDKESGIKVTNLSALWVASNRGEDDTQETLINGVKQGFKQFDDRNGKASVVSRKCMLERYIKIQQLLERLNHKADVNEHPESRSVSYSALKYSSSRMERKAIKDAFVKGVGGWVSNASEDDFPIEHCLNKR